MVFEWFIVRQWLSPDIYSKHETNFLGGKETDRSRNGTGKYDARKFTFIVPHFWGLEKQP